MIGALGEAGAMMRQSSVQPSPMPTLRWLQGMSSRATAMWLLLKSVFVVALQPLAALVIAAHLWFLPLPTGGWPSRLAYIASFRAFYGVLALETPVGSFVRQRD